MHRKAAEESGTGCTCDDANEARRQLGGGTGNEFLIHGTSMGRVSRARCVGRDAELGAIADELVRARSGVRWVSVTGDPGIGTSTLLREVAHATDATVFAATALEAEQGMAGAVLAQLLQQEPTAVPAMAEALLARVSSEAVSLVVIDDAHLADDESWETLTGILARHRDLRVLVVAGATARFASDTLQNRFFDNELRLGGLDAEAVSEIVHDRGIILHPSMREDLWRHTMGNPRDLIGLLDESPRALWSQPGGDLPAPEHVRADIRARLDACPDDGRRLIEAFAVLDDGQSLTVAAALAEAEDTFAAADHALATGLLTRSADLAPAQVGLALRSPLVRAAVIDAMGLQATADAHRRAAEIVPDPVARLHHRVAATPDADPALADELDELARARAAEGAWREAATLLRQSSRITQEGLKSDERVTRSVDALLSAGDCSAAATLIPSVESLRETPLRNATLAYLAILRGRATEAEVRLDRAWAIVNPEREPDIAALIAGRRVLHALIRGQGTELIDWVDRAVALTGPDSPAGVEATVIRGLGEAWAGRPTEGVTTYAQLSEVIRHGAQAQRAVMGRGWLEYGIDDLDVARASLETAVSMARLGGSDRITLWSLAWLARVRFIIGDWDAAFHTATQGRDLATTSGITIATPLLEWTVAQIHSLLGRWDDAHAAVRRAEAVGTDYPSMEIPARLARAQVAEAAADYATVIHELGPLPRLARSVPALVEPGFWPWVDTLANALVLEGRLDDADALLTPHEKRADERKHSSASARLGYARGRLLGASGDINGARHVFERAVELLLPGPNRYDLARVNFAYGQTLRRAGKRRDADRVMSIARETYLGLGAQTYVDRCDRELKAGGLHTSPVTRHDVSLTPQEESVTALVAQGLSNKEVAAELFISTKTVQYHLTRIYAKLGLRSRAELVASHH